MNRRLRRPRAGSHDQLGVARTGPNGWTASLPVHPPEERHQRLRTPGSPNSATSRSVRYSSGSSIPFEKWEPYFSSVKVTE